MNRIVIFIIIIFAFIGCEDVNEKHEQYLLEGSPTYAGKIDSLDCLSGFYRVKASVYPSIDVNRKEFRIYWNNFTDSVVYSYDASYLNLETGRYEVIIDGFDQDMIEGYTTLTFRNYDSQGNKSRETESTVLIYGNDFASGILNQGVSGFDGQYLNFVYRNGAVGLLVEYTTNENTQRTVEFRSTIEKLKIIGLNPDLPDFKSGSRVLYKTLYHFEATDIDSIYAGSFSESDPLILPDPLIVKENFFNKYGYEETFNIPVEVYEGESFTSVSDQPWCSVVDDVESGNIEVSVGENTLGSRTATITVSVDGKTGSDFTKEILVVQSDAIRLDHTKAGWSETLLPDDNSSAWGWTLPHLWDGNNGGAGYHTEDNAMTPILFSIDFGKQLLVDGVEIVPRASNVRNPEIYEVWASDTLGAVGVDRDSPDWEAKSIEAGWVKIKSIDFSGWTDAGIRIAYVGATEKYRYMRIRVLKNSAGSPAPMNIMELSIIGKE
ncbi:DUF4998 domain-containing protein [Sunxiuqinia sp. sy24]|uniref:DUF4998 domain-containing protein n=1 Tax=Sunxiuqinia sp. sy24 TaxID=3461495 RepID=UPI00404523CC